MRVWLCVCWSLCCCDAQMLALRRSLWGYCPRSRGASTVPRLDRQPSVLAVGRALRSLLLSATVAAPRSPCCLLLCLCSFVSTVLVSACPGVGVNIFEDINKYTRFQRNAAPQCSSAHTNMRYGIATSILLFTKASIYAPAQPAGLPTIISHLSRLPGSV